MPRSACPSHEHTLSRRQFLGGSLGLLGWHALLQPAVGRELQTQQKRVLLVWMSGALSQLESWDPKPGAVTGGPFRAIPTSVPGLHISELLPYTARQMHRLVVLRGVSTGLADHRLGTTLMQTGRRPEAAQDYPYLGSAVTKWLGAPDATLPGFMHITPPNFPEDDKAQAFLGPKYAALTLPNGQPPANLLRQAALSEDADRLRRDFRAKLDRGFTQGRAVAETEAYTHSFEQAAQLMRQRQLFSIDREPVASRERYGHGDFGRHCLLARRLLEQGVSCVQLTHGTYDTHTENFEFHLEKLTEFDRPFATLIDDLHERGMLASTLVVVMSEFGRTPKINAYLGRDHWATAWSVVAGGCGLKQGVVLGKTNADGTAVTERPMNSAQLFHTWFRAVGLDTEKKYHVNQRPIPVAEPDIEPVAEVLA
jgi:hypothetical protein